jgi:AcrR family transcriptional regulator
MVMRYFGSKAGLFSAASTMHLEVPDLVAVPAADRGERLVRQFVDRWEDPVRRGALVILLRTAATDDAVRAQLQDVIGELVLDPVATVAVDHAARRGALIGSQLLGVALCRYVYGIEPMASLPVDEVIAAVAPVVQRYLTEPSVEDVARR